MIAATVSIRDADFIADFLEKKAKTAHKKVIKKRRGNLTNLRKKYMDARAEARANLKKERTNREAQLKKDLTRIPRNKRASKRKLGNTAIKKMWKLFRDKYPHWKKILTVAQLRKLTETVKTHRLSL